MEEPKSKAKRGAKTAAAAQEDKITLLPLSELHDFPNHPFKVRDDEVMQETTESNVVLSADKLRKYFPRSYTPQKMEETILKLLDAWLRKRQRDQSR